MFSLRILGSIQHGGRQEQEKGYLATSRQYGSALQGICYREEEVVRTNTESIKCHPLFKVDYWTQTYRDHDLHFSRSSDIIVHSLVDHVTIRIAICHFYWWSHGTEPLSVEVFEIFASKYIWHDHDHSGSH